MNIEKFIEWLRFDADEYIRGVIEDDRFGPRVRYRMIMERVEQMLRMSGSAWWARKPKSEQRTERYWRQVPWEIDAHLDRKDALLALGWEFYKTNEGPPKRHSIEVRDGDMGMKYEMCPVCGLKWSEIEEGEIDCLYDESLPDPWQVEVDLRTNPPAPKISVDDWRKVVRGVADGLIDAAFKESVKRGLLPPPDLKGDIKTPTEFNEIKLETRPFPHQDPRRFRGHGPNCHAWRWEDYSRCSCWRIHADEYDGKELWEIPF